MKKCKKCRELKSLDKFFKHKIKKDGLQIYCKDCSTIRNIEYYRTKEGLLTKIYGGQRSGSKRKERILPNYTKQKLKDWLFKQNLFHELFNDWVSSNYDKMLTPSVDRKKDNFPYSLDNIQLMTWQQNKDKGHRDMRLGKIINGVNPQKPVIQYDKQGNFIAEYCSLRQAKRETGISNGGISENCNGTRKSAGGFIWKFKCN